MTTASDRFERYGEGAGPELAGKLVKFTSLGCYPVFYIAKDGCATLCANCANGDEGEEGILAADVNWEDADLWCEGCNCRIESAYAEDDVHAGE